MSSSVTHAVLLIAACALPAVTQAGTLDRISSTGVVKIGHRETSVPFSFLDDDKKPVGYAIDLCRSIVRSLEKVVRKPLRIEFVPVTSASRIAAVVEGRVDLECGSTTNNSERRKQVAFTIPHYIAGARWLVRTDSGAQEVDQLKQATVAVIKGSTTVKLVRQVSEMRALDLQLKEVKDEKEAFELLEAKSVKAFSIDDVLLYSMRANAKRPDDYKVIGEFLSIEPLAIMLAKGDPSFKKFVDREVSRVMLDGEINDIYERWFLKPIPPRGVVLNLPMNRVMREFVRIPTDSVGD
ncbi:MAG: hypothetical protein RL341_156 [Pseudomonadota bacterium]